MTGRANYTSPSNGSAPNFGTDLANVYAWFDTRQGREYFALISNLPASGNFAGRSAYVDENKATYVHDGSSWVLTFQPWTTYTPTVTAVTLGSGGTHVAKYMKTGKRVSVHITTTLGTGGAFTGQPTYTLPSNSVGPVPGWFQSGGFMYDVSGSVERFLQMRRNSAGVTGLYGVATAAAFTGLAAVNATNPWTWAVGDIVEIWLDYEEA